LAPADYHVQFSLGRYLKLQGKPEQAEHAFVKATELAPQAVEPWLALGDLYLTVLNRPQQAISAYRSAVARDRKRAVSHYALGVALFKAGEAEAALSELAKSGTLDPANPLPFLERTKIQMALKRWQDAEGDLQEALRRQPGLLEARLLRAELWLVQGEKAEAEAAYRQLLRAHPDLALAYNNLAWLLLEHNLSEAERMASKAVALAPTQAQFQETLSAVYFAQGKLSKACQVLQQALKMAPQDPLIQTRWREKQSLCEKHS